MSSTSRTWLLRPFQLRVGASVERCSEESEGMKPHFFSKFHSERHEMGWPTTESDDPQTGRKAAECCLKGGMDEGREVRRRPRKRTERVLSPTSDSDEHFLAAARALRPPRAYPARPRIPIRVSPPPSFRRLSILTKKSFPQRWRESVLASVTELSIRKRVDVSSC